MPPSPAIAFLTSFDFSGKSRQPGPGEIEAARSLGARLREARKLLDAANATKAELMEVGTTLQSRMIDLAT